MPRSTVVSLHIDSRSQQGKLYILNAAPAGGITYTLTSSNPAAASVPPPPPVPAAPTLLSPANDARPAQPVTFDWSDVSGAASYTTQIDDSSTFPAPLVVSNSVAVSQASTGNLPARQLWWRVRATASNGTSGNWSAVRRFEVKN